MKKKNIAITMIAITVLTLYGLVGNLLLQIVGEEMRGLVLSLIVLNTIMWVVLLIKKWGNLIGLPHFFISKKNYWRVFFTTSKKHVIINKKGENYVWKYSTIKSDIYN